MTLPIVLAALSALAASAFIADPTGNRLTVCVISSSTSGGPTVRSS